MQELEVMPGMAIWDVRRVAIQKAIAEKTDVSFTFNGKQHVVTQEKARSEMTPERFQEYLESLYNEEKGLIDTTERLRVRTEKERQFANQHLGLDLPKTRFKNPKNV